MRGLGGFAGILLVLAIADTTAPSAEACGNPAIFKTSRVRRAAGVSAKPATMLLVGTPPKRLENDLTTAGHHVEVTPDASSHKLPAYDVVVVASSEQAEAVRKVFPQATIVVRSGDVTIDVRSIEGEANRRVIRVATARQPKDYGPKRDKPLDTSPAPGTGAIQHDEPRQEPTKTAPPAPTLDTEVYFGVNSAALGDKHTLDDAATWLTGHGDAHATVEGYADPTGGRDWNMTLSQQRAEAVRDYLVAHGVDAARLEVVGYGDTKTKYDGADKRNRRVAIEVK